MITEWQAAIYSTFFYHIILKSSLDIPNDIGQTPLHLFFKLQLYRRLLLDKKSLLQIMTFVFENANFNVRDNQGHLPLSYFIDSNDWISKWIQDSIVKIWMARDSHFLK